MSAHRSTIKDIALAAGVSPRAVSAALNDTGRVSPATRERVRSLARQLNYRPNVMARALVRSRTYMVGAVFPYANVSFFNEIISGIEARCTERNYDVLLGNASLLHAEEEQRAIQRMLDRRIDGIVCAPDVTEVELFRNLAASGPPVLQVMTRLPGVDLPYIGVDNELGGSLACRHLLDLGHRNIAFLASTRPNYAEIDQRRRGYHAALTEARIEPQPERNEIACDLTIDGGRVATQRLLRHNSAITAIFAPTDYAAIGAVQGCLALGLRVPEEISVIGYDDLEVAAAQILYPLTTVAQPKRDIGIQAFDLLEALIEGEHVASRLLHPTLVPRSTTARSPR